MKNCKLSQKYLQNFHPPTFYHAHEKHILKFKRIYYLALTWGLSAEAWRLVAVALQRCFSMRQRSLLAYAEQSLPVFWIITVRKFQMSRNNPFGSFTSKSAFPICLSYCALLQSPSKAFEYSLKHKPATDRPVDDLLPLPLETWSLQPLLDTIRGCLLWTRCVLIRGKTFALLVYFNINCKVENPMHTKCEYKVTHLNLGWVPLVAMW